MEKSKTAKRSMEVELLALRAGEISPDAFARATEKDWAKMAKVLHGRWALPPSVDEEDIQQELLLAMIEPKPKSKKTLLQKWDPERATKLSRYVVFYTHADVAKRIHRMREAYRRKGSEQGRFAVSMAALGIDSSYWVGDDKGLTTDAGEGAEEVEDSATAHEVRRLVMQVLTRVERLVFRVLVQVGGDVETAAARLEESLTLSIATGVGSADEAQCLIGTVMERAREVARSLA